MTSLSDFAKGLYISIKTQILLTLAITILFRLYRYRRHITHPSLAVIDGSPSVYLKLKVFRTGPWNKPVFKSTLTRMNLISRYDYEQQKRSAITPATTFYKLENLSTNHRDRHHFDQEYGLVEPKVGTGFHVKHDSGGLSLGPDAVWMYGLSLVYFGVPIDEVAKPVCWYGTRGNRFTVDVESSFYPVVDWTVFVKHQRSKRNQIMDGLGVHSSSEVIEVIKIKRVEETEPRAKGEPKSGDMFMGLFEIKYSSTFIESLSEEQKQLARERHQQQINNRTMLMAGNQVENAAQEPMI